jgi:hypothetical protein
MANQLNFIAALHGLFPRLSNAMLCKCWDDVKQLPEPAREALYTGLAQGATAAREARQALAAAITNSIGMEKRAP